MRAIFCAAVAALALGAGGVAQAQDTVQQVNVVSATNMTRELVAAANALPANSTIDDYLRAFIAKIAASGANQPTIRSGIDAAIGTPGLTQAAVSALESLRNTGRDRRIAGGGVARERAGIIQPQLSTSGGSDYLR